ncbi:MAG: hypothetical protein AB7I35_21805 [Ramlibacter sp.]
MAEGTGYARAADAWHPQPPGQGALQIALALLKEGRYATPACTPMAAQV